MDTFKLLSNNKPSVKNMCELEQIKKDACNDGYIINTNTIFTNNPDIINYFGQYLVLNKVEHTNKETNEKQTYDMLTINLPMPLQYMGEFIKYSLYELFDIIIKADEHCLTIKDHIYDEIENELSKIGEHNSICSIYPLRCHNESLLKHRRFGFDYDYSKTVQKELDEHCENILQPYIDNYEHNNTDMLTGIDIVNYLEKEEKLVHDKQISQADEKYDVKQCPILFGINYDFADIQKKMNNIKNFELLTYSNVQHIVNALLNICNDKMKNMNADDKLEHPTTLKINNIFNKLTIYPQLCNLLNEPEYRKRVSVCSKIIMFHHQLIIEEMGHKKINNWKNSEIRLWSLNDLEFERNNLNDTIKKYSDIQKSLQKTDFLNKFLWCSHQMPEKKDYDIETFIQQIYYDKSHTNISKMHNNNNNNNMCVICEPHIPTLDESVKRFHMFTNNLLNFSKKKNIEHEENFYKNCVITGGCFAYCVCMVMECKTLYKPIQHKNKYESGKITHTSEDINCEIFGLNMYDDENIDCAIYVGEGITLSMIEFEILVDEKIQILNEIHKNNSQDENVFWMEQNNNKYYILNSKGFRTIECYQIPFNQANIWQHIASFHFGCVRGYFDGTMWHILPSAIPAILLKYSIDIRMIPETSNACELVKKYMLRGFAINMNMVERFEALDYFYQNTKNNSDQVSSKLIHLTDIDENGVHKRSELKCIVKTNILKFGM